MNDIITIHEGRAIAFKLNELEDLSKSLNKEIRELKKFIHGKFKLVEDEE